MNVLLLYLNVDNEELYEVKCDEHFIKFRYRKKNPRKRHPLSPFSTEFTVQKSAWRKLLEHDCPEDTGR